MKKRGKLKGKVKVKSSGSRKVASTAKAAAAASSTAKKQYRKIKYVVKEVVRYEGNSKMEITTILHFEACFELDDEKTRQLIYGQLLTAGARPLEIKEFNTDEYTAPFYKEFTKYKDITTDEEKPYGKKHTSDINPTKNSPKELKDKALAEVLAKVSGDSLTKLHDMENSVEISKATRAGETFLSSRAYKQSRIDAAMLKAGNKQAKYLEKLNKDYEKSREKIDMTKEDYYKSIRRTRKLLNDYERVNERLGEIGYMLETYMGGPFVLVDPQYWKDLFKRAGMAISAASAMFVEGIKKEKEETLFKRLEELRGERMMVNLDKREAEAKARVEEKILLREELTEERLKERALERIKRNVEKYDGGKTEEEKQAKIKTKFNEELVKISEMKLAKSGAFERLPAMAERDRLYQDVIDTFNRADAEIYGKTYKAKKAGDEKKVKELEEASKKIKEEKSRLVQQRDNKNYNPKEKPETKEELDYIKKLGENKEKGYEKIVSLVEKEEKRLAKLPKDEETPKEAPVLKDEPKKPELKPEPKTDKKEEKKPELKPKEVKQTDKNSENKPKEAPRSEKVVGIDRDALENEFKAARTSKEPRKHYHEVGDEQNMMDDLLDKGLSHEEARAYVDKYFEKFDEEQRQKELLKAQPKDNKETKVEPKPEAKEKVETKVEAKPEPKPEPKVEQPKDKQEPKPEPKIEPKFENKIDKKEDNKPVEAWKREDFLRDLREARDFLESFADLNEKVQESYENSSLKDENEWEKKDDLDNVRQDLKMINNMIEEIKETIPKERNLTKVDDMGSVFERKEEIGSVFEKPTIKGEIDMSRFKDMKANFGLIEKALRETYKPKIELLKKERLAALAKPKLDAKERRKKLEQTYNETIGKEKEAEKQEAKKQEELKKQKQEQEKKDKQTKELKPKTAPEIGGPSGLNR